jgi:hypothetical protein
MSNLKTLLKKTGLKEYNVHFGMFDFSFNCIVGDYKQLPKYLAYKFESTEEKMREWNEQVDYGYTPRGRWFRHGDHCPVVWIPKKPKTPREIATLAHEILHVVYELCRWAAIPLDASSEEVRTHAQAHALTTLLKEIK